MRVSRLNLCFHLLVLVSIFFICKSDDSECTYLLYIKTGSVARAGTHSTISLSLYDGDGNGVAIDNLETWGGLMGPGYNYFETGNLDIFGGRGPCLTGPVCALNLTSNGSGPYHAWYCEFVEVTTTGVQKQCTQQKFTVDQWLAKDEPPYSLTATRNYCLSDDKIRLVGDSDFS